MRWVGIALVAGLWACDPGSEVIAEGHQVYVRGLASDTSGLYWVDDPVTTTGRRGVFRLAPDGQLLELADGIGNGIALDDEQVYWFDRDRAAVVRVSKQGGAVETLVDGLAGDSGFALAGKRLYVVDTGWDRPEARILAADTDGGDALVIASSLSPAGWAPSPVLFRDRLYWQDDDQLLSMSVDGGPVARERSGAVVPGSLAADDLGIYFTTEAGDVVWRTDGDEIALATDEMWATYATPAGAHVYFSAWRGEDSSDVLLRRVTRDGSAVETVAVDDVLLCAIALAPAGPVYFADGELAVRAADP
jgi:hypothetical protein